MAEVKLKVGQVWKDRYGKQVEIVKEVFGRQFPFFGNNGVTYTHKGFQFREGDESRNDLIELVRDVEGPQATSEPQPDTLHDGWLPWDGGECPVDPNALVEYKMRGGASSVDNADEIMWNHSGSSSDIIAYRVVEQPAASSEPKPHSHYFKDVSILSEIDVYRVCELFGVDDSSGATHHAIKKLLCAGKRGAKDRKKDIQEAIDTLKRRIEMWEEVAQ